MEDTIKTRWNVLPEEQQKGIRQFLTNVIISVATTGDAKQRVYLHKLNLVLVQVRPVRLAWLPASPHAITPARGPLGSATSRVASTAAWQALHGSCRQRVGTCPCATTPAHTHRLLNTAT